MTHPSSCATGSALETLGMQVNSRLGKLHVAINQLSRCHSVSGYSNVQNASLPEHLTVYAVYGVPSLPQVRTIVVDLSYGGTKPDGSKIWLAPWLSAFWGDGTEQPYLAVTSPGGGWDLSLHGHWGLEEAGGHYLPTSPKTILVIGSSRRFHFRVVPTGEWSHGQGGMNRL